MGPKYVPYTYMDPLGSGAQAYSCCHLAQLRLAVAAGRNLCGGFPRIGATILGVPITRTIAFLGLYWGPPILGNYYLRREVYYMSTDDLGQRFRV